MHPQPKTGLAGRMRDWMRGQTRAFSPKAVCNGVGAAGTDRARVRNAFPDFLARGEISRNGAGLYRYNQGWKRNEPAPVSQRIYKAIYLSGKFTSFDIQRLSGADSRNFIQKRLRTLLADGYIERVEKVPGNVWFYKVINRKRFRIEML